MEMLASATLLLVFLVHLVAFAVLGLRRKERYYLALVITFGLLSASIAVRMGMPGMNVGEWPLHQVLRILGWAAAAVSISWTATRLVVRFRSRQSHGAAE